MGKGISVSSKILVVGDCMLDRYWHGDVTRLSQEAPVPVVRTMHEENRAGAAANVALNIAAMGGDVTLIGITGDDENGRILDKLLSGIRRDLLWGRSTKTTTKLRVIGRKQQICRVDFDQQPGEAVVKELQACALRRIDESDIVVISDYAKGALADVGNLIKHARAAGKTVIVDPKGADYDRYRGADLVKPNLDEMRHVSGAWHSESDLSFRACQMRLKHDFGAILLTRGEDGMALFDAAGEKHIRAAAREVYDVTGAGDTVMASIAVELSKGRTLTEAATTANYAAGIAVGKFGTAVVTMQEIEDAKNGTA